VTIDEIKRIPNQDRVTGPRRVELRRTLLRHYDSGVSIRDLMRATGRSYGFVHRLLTEAGATMRARGGARQRRDRT
jgi:hypothetical protein